MRLLNFQRFALCDLRRGGDMAAKKESRFFDAKENMALSKRQAYYNQSLAKMVRLGCQKDFR